MTDKMNEITKDKLAMKAFLSIVNVCGMLGVSYGKLDKQMQTLLLEAYRQGGVDMLEELKK